MKARKLCELDYVLCASPAVLKDIVVPQHPEDIPSHRVVSYFSASTGKRFPLRFQRGEERTEHVPISGSISVNDSTAHINALVAGLGIGQTFGFLARPHMESGALIELLPDWKPQNHLLHLIYPADRFPNPRLRAFTQWASALFETVDARRIQASAIVHPHG